MLQYASIIFWGMVIFFAGSGCTLIRYSDQIGTLRAIDENMRNIAEDISAQEAYVDKLIKDVKNNRLVKGLSRKAVIDKYGKPVIVKQADNGTFGQVFLYRHPVNYFTCDKVYLYFDVSGRLLNWKYNP